MSALVAPWPGVRRRQRRPRLQAFQRRPVVYGAMVVYTFLSIGLMATHSVGLTSEHVILIGIVAFAVVGRARPFVWDWLPFLFVAVMFEDLTSVGAALAASVHTIGPIAMERSLLGGAVATTWLQAHIGTSHLVPVLNAVLTGEYLFHFGAPLAAGLWLWLRHRERFGRFVSAYMILMTTGFLIYLLFPEMPPWLAARSGLLPPVHRIVVESLQQVAGFGQVYSGADPEPNAAMPSLHVAVPMLIACTVVGGSKRRRIAWLWMLYPLTISFGVVYLGEHYVADALVGLGLGLACYGAVEIGGVAAARSAIRRRISSRSRRMASGLRPAGSSSSQSRYRLPGMYGQASPQPMVTTTSAHSPSAFSRHRVVRPEMSMPSSAMASTTTRFTSAAGSDPADRA
ncbi:MAG: inositol phosphorylceramide synthase [Chloroflexi bacterium]|nr:MAG: inositol phosphorylceramide synthase [Chloroflexota bacterium]